MPKSKSVALVDFTEPSHARAAFKGLAYRRYHHTPIYLEWAPLHVVNKERRSDVIVATTNKKEEKKIVAPNVDQNSNRQVSSGSVQVESSLESPTLFVKNLNFSSSENSLRDHISKFGLGDAIRAISLPTKMKGDAKVSMGYGFVEFKSSSTAVIALSRINETVLDGHTLQVKASDKILSPSSNNSQNNKKSTKLIVRNVAFQATQREIRDLFSTFGAVKRVRIPKRIGGVHRGFAFVDFSSAQEASTAKQALANTHLYGRHLVIEWADDEETTIDALRKRTEIDQAGIKFASQAKRQKTNGDAVVADESEAANFL